MGLDASNLIINHLKLRPEAMPRDIYKLLYQGVFGVGHIISHRAWDVLVEEAGRIDLDDHVDDPLFEPVSPDGSMVRVYLRQYINMGGDLETLFRVMKESALTSRGSMAQSDTSSMPMHCRTKCLTSY